MARPRKQFALTAEQIELLASYWCSDDEIAAVAQVSENTLRRYFADVLKKGRADARIALRKKQFEQAMKGNTAMLIWLGKQYLGQTDSRDVRIEDRGPVPVVTAPLSAAIAAVAADAADASSNGRHA